MIDKHWFVLISVPIATANAFVYIRSVLRGKTKPHVFSWFVWGLTMGIGGAAQFVDHAGLGAWLTFYGAFICFITTLISLRYGEKNITTSDWLAFITALAAIPLWIITQNPLLAVILVTLIDTLGFYPNIRKSWANPKQESPVAFLVFSFSSLMTLLALENYSLITVLYPASLMSMEVLQATVIVWQRQNRKN